MNRQVATTLPQRIRIAEPRRQHKVPRQVLAAQTGEVCRVERVRAKTRVNFPLNGAKSARTCHAVKINKTDVPLIMRQTITSILGGCDSLTRRNRARNDKKVRVFVQKQPVASSAQQILRSPFEGLLDTEEPPSDDVDEGDEKQHPEDKIPPHTPIYSHPSAQGFDDPAIDGTHASSSVLKYCSSSDKPQSESLVLAPSSRAGVVRCSIAKIPRVPDLDMKQWAKTERRESGNTLRTRPLDCVTEICDEDSNDSAVGCHKLDDESGRPRRRIVRQRSSKTMALLKKLGVSAEEAFRNIEENLNDGECTTEDLLPPPQVVSNPYEEDQNFIDGLVFLAPNREDCIRSMLGHPSRRYMPRSRSTGNLTALEAPAKQRYTFKQSSERDLIRGDTIQF